MKMTRVVGWTRLLAAAGVCIGVSGTALAQSDSCGTPVAIGLGTSPVDTTGFTQDQPSPSCGFNATFTLDGWFSFTADGDGGQYSFETGPATPEDMDDTVISIYSTCGGAELACDDDDSLNGLYSLIPTLALGPNETVLIRIAGFDNTAGACTLTIGEVSALLNDNCAGAEALTLDTPVTGDSTTATSELAASSCSLDDNIDLFYSFTAPADGTFRFAADGFTGAFDVDATLEIFTDCTFATSLGCADDPNDGTVIEIVDVVMTMGQTVIARVAGFDGDAGPFGIEVTDASLVPPGDTCDDPIVVNDTDFPLTAQTNDFSQVNNPPAGCAFFGLDGNDIFYLVTPSQTGTAQITLTPTDSAFDSVLSAAADCLSIDATAFCSDNTGTNGVEAVSIPVTMGTPFVIRVAGWLSEIGTFDLSMTIDVATPDNDDCAMAEALVAGDPPIPGTNVNSTGTSAGCPFDMGPDETDVFYTLTNSGAMTSSFRVEVAPDTGSLDAVISAFTDCTLATRLACSDVFIPGVAESLTVSIPSMSSVIIRVSGSGNTSGSFTIFAEDLGAPPANADCAMAQVILEGTLNTISADNSAVAPNGVNSNCSFQAADDSNALFYSFTADATGGTYVISTGPDDTAGGLDATLSVFSQCSDQPFGLACVDDDFTSAESVELFINANETVIIRVGGWALTSGPFDITVLKQVPPTNDTCATAIDASAGGTFVVDFPQLALASDGVDPSCDGSTSTEAAFGVWYSFTAPAGDNGTLLSADFGPNLTNYTVYTGSCGTLTEAACTGTFELILPMTAGQSVFILVSMDDDTVPVGPYDLEFLFVADAGACCDGSSCTIDSASACATAGGTWQGAGVACFGEPMGAPQHTSSNVTAIADNVTNTDSIVVTDTTTIASLDVQVAFTHTFLGDVHLSISKDGGTPVFLTQNAGGGNEVNGTFTFSDSGAQTLPAAGDLPASGTYLASEDLGLPVSLNAAFAGASVAGTWTLTVFDDAGGDTGSVTSWGLFVNAGDPACGSAPCLGDYNGDTAIDLADLIAFNTDWQPNIGLTVPAGTNGDYNGDTMVDLADLIAFNTDWQPNIGLPCP